MKIKILLIALFTLVSISLLGQNYLEDARLLVKFKEIYERNDKINFQGKDLTYKESIDSMTLDDIFSAELSGFEEFEGQNNNDKIINEKFKEIHKNEFKVELQKIIEFCKNGDKLFNENGNIKFKEFPREFKYLKNIVNTLEDQNDQTGWGTKTFPINSIGGVSQVDIYKAIADWSLKRAEEELMKAFLRDWIEKIQNDTILEVMFPNTLNMLTTSDLTTMVTDGDLWKQTFKQDFDDILEKVPSIVELSMNTFNLKVTNEIKKEIVAGFSLFVNIYNELQKEKMIDDVFIAMGGESYTKKGKTVIDKSLMSLNIILTGLKTKEESGKSGYVSPNEILNLTDKEAKFYWAVIYLREREKFKLVFNITNNNDEKEFYKKIYDSISNYKVHISKIAGNIKALSNFTGNNKEKLTIDQYHNYVLLSFDLIENSLNFLHDFVIIKDSTNLKKIKQVKDTYLDGFKYVTYMNEGVKTKQYGKLALNSINLLLWLNKLHGTINKNNIKSKFCYYDIIKDTSNCNKEKLENLKKLINDSLELFPDSKKIILSKYNLLSKDSTYDLSNEKLMKKMELSDKELELILDEINSKLLSTSESLNKFLKVMTGILSAKDEDDVGKLLDNVAMKTGGYLVRQQSVFSASVTFYPGLECGWEKISKIPGSIETTEFDFGYFGATLPIGIELAAGTNWKPVSAVGLFFQLIDLGAVMNYSINSDIDSLQALPEFGFKQVFSPGANLTLHICNTPVTIGYGVSFSPNLRNITDGEAVLGTNALQQGFFLSVDLNVFPIYSSKKKYTVKSKSLGGTYGN